MLLFFLDGLAAVPGLGELATLESTAMRAALAGTASFVLALVLGRRLIGWLKTRFREPIKSASAEVARLHQSKQATPTMGGLFIIAGLVASSLAFGDWSNPYLPIALLLAVALAALGALDDLIKLRSSARGLRARTKFFAQIAIALGVAVLIYRVHLRQDQGLLFGGPLFYSNFELGWLFIPLVTFVIVGSSNAVNLADGLDGLAGGCLVCAGCAMGLVVFASGSAEWAGGLNIPYIEGAGEMAVVAAAMIGALLGFLWFNCHPASVFMGDTGALPLGGLLGLLAVIARQELLLVAVGGVFVVEAASVIAQVVFFRWKRRRIFLCAPLHHHFQLQGWPENKIVTRFWIAGALCALVGLSALKLHPRDEPSALQVTELQQLARSGSELPR